MKGSGLVISTGAGGRAADRRDSVRSTKSRKMLGRGDVARKGRVRILREITKSGKKKRCDWETRRGGGGGLVRNEQSDWLSVGTGRGGPDGQRAEGREQR
jgi:hypothetical protein